MKVYENEIPGGEFLKAKNDFEKFRKEGLNFKKSIIYALLQAQEERGVVFEFCVLEYQIKEYYKQVNRRTSSREILEAEVDMFVKKQNFEKKYNKTNGTISLHSYIKKLTEKYRL